MDKMYYAIGEVAKQSGLSTTTLNRWHNNARLYDKRSHKKTKLLDIMKDESL